MEQKIIRNSKGQFVKGQKILLSAESREKIRQKLIGHKLSEESKRKIGIKNTGRIKSEDTRKKMGIKSSMYWKGRKKTEEHKRNLSLSKKGKYCGDKNPNWKGGVSKDYHNIRTSSETKSWRTSVFERDNYTCQKYGTIGHSLVAHHINNFSNFPELRFDVNNGITLSRKAHIEFHKKYGMKNNTIEQLKEFLNK